MLDAETKLQMQQFIDELREWLKENGPEGDYRWLYAKYPKVRIGIRRAILVASKGPFKFEEAVM
jgi:hypothetical protein